MPVGHESSLSRTGLFLGLRPATISWRVLHEPDGLVGDPTGIRTRDTTVKGWCLNRLTIGPYKKLAYVFLVYFIIFEALLQGVLVGSVSQIEDLDFATFDLPSIQLRCIGLGSRNRLTIGPYRYSFW